MERFSQRESVLLGHNLQSPFANHPSSSPKSQYRNSDVDFTDVFGGPPRRSSVQEVRFSLAEPSDSCLSKSGDVDMKLSRNSLSSLNEKPVFGDENVNRRRYPSKDFFDDIFKGNESLSSSPRMNDRDSFSSTSGPRVLSPARVLPPRTDPWSPSLPAQFSLPAKLIKGSDLPTFISSSRGPHKNKDDASNGVNNYTYSPLSRCARQRNHVQDELPDDVSQQRSLSSGLSLSNEESSNLTSPEKTDKSRNFKRDSDSSEVSDNGSNFHFSFYRWASKGMPFTRPLRGASKSRMDDNCKFQRCSSVKGWVACEGIARELHSETPRNVDIFSCSNRMELDKQSNSFLFQSSTQSEVEHCQIVEDRVFPISELDTPSSHQMLVEDVPGNSISENSVDKIKSHSVHETVSRKVKEEIPVVKQEARNTGLKPLRTLLSENDDKQGIDEVTRKTGLKESKIKVTKKASAVFDVDDNAKDRDEKITPSNGIKADKANFQSSPTYSRESLVKSRARGKVKEFVKIFNQEGSEKPNFYVDDSQRRGSRQKERSQFRCENATNEKMGMPEVDKKTMADASNLVDEFINQSEKQHPETRASNLKSACVSSQRKDSLVSTAADIPDNSKIITEDTDMSFLLIAELPQDENKVPKTSDIDEGIKVIDDKIQKWSKGKEGSIRSLLSTLQYVLWSKSGWKPVPLVDIIEGNAVKRTYQKALLYLHPDKLQQKGASAQQKYTAEKVFDILQEAWNHFNSLGGV